MDVQVVVFAVTGALLAGLAVGAFSMRRWMQGQIEEVLDAEREKIRHKALDEMYQAITAFGPRYEMKINDTGVDGEMRYRWEVWDADRAMKVQAAEGPLSEAEAIGVGLPFMLGNSATGLDAEIQAMAWVATQRPESVVL